MGSSGQYSINPCMHKGKSGVPETNAGNTGHEWSDSTENLKLWHNNHYFCDHDMIIFRRYDYHRKF